MPTARLRSYRPGDLEQLVAIQRECFPPPFPAELWWTKAQIASHCHLFPEGALCAEAEDGSLVGSATAHLLRWDPQDPDHTWAEAADGGMLANHEPDGDTLYGVDVAVRPAWRGRGIARQFYQARFALVRSRGLRRFLAGSRISGYHLHRDRLSPEAYAAEVVAGRLSDPVVTPQLRAGLVPVRVVRGYLPDAEASDCALLMQWQNPDIP
ncbi:MAG: GNAT family N-acetyltransferase [Planctomycetes bacterium]|nr:GNAT family N-acetyltransferase [Planctomycetota bacterium]